MDKKNNSNRNLKNKRGKSMYYFIVNPASKTGVGAKYWKRVEKVLEEKKF